MERRKASDPDSDLAKLPGVLSWVALHDPYDNDDPVSLSFFCGLVRLQPVWS